jgi:dolichol-phosphate mannosyltransferase
MSSPAAPGAPRGELARVVKFICVGLAGTAFALALFALFNDVFGIDYRVSAALSISLSYAVNFFVNRRWTFRAHTGSMAPQAIRFALVSALATGVNVVAVHLLHESAGIAEFPSEALAIIVATPFSYLGNRWWTFDGARRPVSDLEAA